MRSNIALKIAPCGRLDAPQAARHLVQRYASRMLHRFTFIALCLPLIASAAETIQFQPMAKVGDERGARFCGSTASQLRSATGSGNLAWRSGAKSRIPVGKSEWLDAIWYHEIKETVLLAYESTDSAEDGSSGGLCSFSAVTGKRSWCTDFPAFNIVAAVASFGDVYLAGIGTIAQVDQVTGKYRWKIQGLYTQHRELNVFRVPVEEGDMVSFYASPDGAASKIKRLSVQHTTGRMVAIEPVKVFPGEATEHVRVVRGCD